jgi:nitroimidazol reductase NimA-like FMN-containing flavoprotein (pyridoxamine 5'-phosphate oxidase superfamily)
MDPGTEDRELVELDADECDALLALESVGRLAVQHPDEAPDVVPVNFVIRAGDPVFRSHDGVLLDRVLGAPVSLQIDRFDWFHRTGWSVLVKGVGELVDPSEWSAATGPEDDEEPDPWVPGSQPRVVRLRAERITGRRIELHQLPTDGRGYL